MRILVFTFFILLPFYCFTQSKLVGFVREQNTGIKIPDVMVRSNVTSNPIASSASGYFMLTFQDLKPGKSITVRAEKEGWELVNEKEMNTLIPENPEEKSFKIILCKAGTLAKAKSRYYETFEMNLQKRFDKERARNKGNEKKIASLEQNFARVQNQLNDLADEFSRIDLSDASENDLKALELFKEGKYDEFITLKNNIVTEAQVDKAIKSKTEATKIIDNSDSTIKLYIKSQKDIANTLILQFKFEEAENIYANIVSKDTTNFHNTFDFAQFIYKQNQHDKAMQYFQRALKLARGEVEIAITQNNLGLLYKDKNDYPAASNAYGQALEIYERLSKSDPAGYELYVALTQNNLGIWYQGKNDYPAALKAYGTALEIFQHLAETNPATYEPEVAMIQHNLGILYRDKNNYPVALSAFSKALEIYVRLAKTKPTIYEPEVARIQNSLGILYKAENDYSPALKAYTTALEIYDRFAKTNPATYEPYMASTQNNLGVLYYAKNDYPAALNAFGKALEIRYRLAKANPSTYEPDVAGTQNNLGALYEALNDYPASLNAFCNALEIYERLAKSNPATYEPFVATTQNNLGVLYDVKGNYPAALNAYGNALEIYKRLAKTNPGTYEPDVAMTQKNLGVLYEGENNYSAALNAFGNSLEIYERLAKTNPTTYEPSVASTQNNLGILYEAKNEFSVAFSAYNKALEIYERLSETNPDAYEIEFCRSIVLLGLLQKANYQENRKMVIQQYLSKANQILPKYTQVPLAKQLLQYVNDLNIYFKK